MIHNLWILYDYTLFFIRNQFIRNLTSALRNFKKLEGSEMVNLRNFLYTFFSNFELARAKNQQECIEL